MNIIKLTAWAPLLLVSLITSLLPRSLFIHTYRPSSELERNLESVARNSLRLAQYYTIKRITK